MHLIQPLLEGYPIVVKFPVAWGEMDSFQHVNNVVYFRYFENARIVCSEKLGLHKYKEQTGIGPILGSTSCKFKYPLTYPDTVSVGAKIVNIADDRFMMVYVVVSHQHGKIAAEGEAVVVMYDYRAGKKTAIPDELRRKMMTLEIS
jgi:acyl-CoA thioester hydrolase